MSVRDKLRQGLGLLMSVSDKITEEILLSLTGALYQSSLVTVMLLRNSPDGAVFKTSQKHCYLAGVLVTKTICKS